jgi:hypothetical protein
MNIALVPKEDYDTIFPHVREYLRKAANLSGGRTTIEHVKSNLYTKPQQLWIAFDEGKIVCGAITEILEYPTKKVLAGLFIGGNQLAEWRKPIVDNMALFAKANNCSCIEFMGRRGWGKVLKQDGWKQTYISYEFPLEN